MYTIKCTVKSVKGECAAVDKVHGGDRWGKAVPKTHSKNDWSLRAEEALEDLG